MLPINPTREEGSIMNLIETTPKMDSASHRENPHNLRQNQAASPHRYPFYPA